MWLGFTDPKLKYLVYKKHLIADQLGRFRRVNLRLPEGTEIVETNVDLLRFYVKMYYIGQMFMYDLTRNKYIYVNKYYEF